MITITIEYGSGNRLSRQFQHGTTLGDVLGNSSVRTGLGYGNNVDGQIGGVTQSASLVLQDGMTVRVVDKANTKAA